MDMYIFMCLTVLSVTFNYVRSNVETRTRNETTQIDEDEIWRIYGGNRINIKKAPYQISLYVREQHRFKCGGVIISKYWALSAAHCTQYKNNEIYIRSGSHRKNMGTIHNIDKIINHEKYGKPDSRNKLEYDISAMKVKNGFKFSPSVQAVKIATELPPPGTKVFISGFGNIHWPSSRGPPQNIWTEYLYGLNTTIIDKQKCQSYWPGAGAEVVESMVCTYMNGKGACFGDSGGPVVLAEERLLLGITSWGDRLCGRTPSVAMNVVFFREWIRNKTSIYKVHECVQA